MSPSAGSFRGTARDSGCFFGQPAGSPLVLATGSYGGLLFLAPGTLGCGTRWGSGTPRSEISLLNGALPPQPESGTGPPLGSAPATGPRACGFLESVLVGLLSPPFSDGAERRPFYGSVATWMGLCGEAGRVHPRLPRTASPPAFFRAGGPPVPLGHLDPWTTPFANRNATLTVPFQNTNGNGMSGEGDIS